jgi:hypothetical protein
VFEHSAEVNILTLVIGTTVHLESRSTLIKGVGSDIHKRLYRPEPFNFIHKHFLQICVQKVTVHL